VRHLVGASGLHVSWLAAFVAHALRGRLGWAIARKVALLAAIVTLLDATLSAVSGHVADTTARVASLATSATSSIPATAKATTFATSAAWLLFSAGSAITRYVTLTLLCC